MVHYGATKAALLGLSRGVAESVAGTGVTVNAFIPGPTKTEKTKAHIMNMAEQVGKPLHQFEKEMFQQQLPFSLIQRFCTPEEVANLVVFLSSNEAGAITGAALHVDGGIIRSIL
jgi:NAD(P)-dependent dehydrogenase (short-subunit alcohol dehydrogenase family)